MGKAISPRAACVLATLAAACDFGVRVADLTSGASSDDAGAFADAAVDGAAQADAADAGEPPALPATNVTVGGAHSCAVRTDGSVVCWGAANNRLGNGLADDSSVPVLVVGLSDAVTVSAGDQHTCATTRRGTVACWGTGTSGQLGLGTNVSVNAAAEVPGLADVASVATGTAFTCAVTTTQRVYCWGLNDNGQLGIGSTENKFGPVLVPGLEGVTKVVAGTRHACAIAQGVARCWGGNDRGQVGIGDGVPRSLVPQDVVGRLQVKDLAAGAEFTCAIVGDARQCWGYNVLGALGNGNTASSPLPVASPHAQLGAIAAGGATTCAIEADGTVSCWGNARAGQLGTGAPLPAGEYLATPTKVTELQGVRSVSVGAQHACALLAEGRVRCWGYNGNGRLGLGTALDAPSPVRVALEGSATALAVGPTHACAVVADGVRCWGNNGNYQLSPNSINPMVATGTPIRIDGRVRGVSVGSNTTCLAEDGDRFQCFGSNSSGMLGIGSSTSTIPAPTFYGGAATPLAVDQIALPAGGGVHSCAVGVDGTTTCTGSNASGQLGAPDAGASVTRPRAVAAMPFEAPIIQLGAGSDFSCAGSSLGVACWGANGNGRLGDGTSSQRNVPWPTLATGVTALTVGSNHACAVIDGDAGEVRCWGRNAEGQIGDGTNSDRSRPTSSLLALRAVRVTAGARHTCVLLADGGGVRCWGDNRYGQLGNGTRVLSSTPTEVGGLTDVVELGAGNETTCVRQRTGEVFCWGRNADGQLGSGTVAVAFKPSPVRTFE